MGVDDVAMTFLHLHLLFTERHEEVLHQSPIEESTIFVHPCHFQASELVHLHQRLEGGGNETFLIVEINEHIEHIARAASFGHIAGGQQDFTIVSPIEVHTEIHFFHHFQLVVFS